MLRKITGSFFQGIRSLLSCRKNLSSELRSRVFPVKIPLALDEKTGWKPYPVFSGNTSRGELLACHFSVLCPGVIAHPVHQHPEEEILVLLSGELELFTSEDQVTLKKAAFLIKPGQMFLYPADFPHTIRSSGGEPAQYMMIKWSALKRTTGALLPFGMFDIAIPEKPARSIPEFHPHILFEGRTACLDKLQCHVTRLAPGSGYPPHEDPYDVVLLMLDGEGMTLGTRITPHDVILYAEGEPHGMHNPGTAPARYLVCEFHW
jgi:mannose-6-phosphate isomerase-like protein (cupin superfamily)